MSRPALYHPVSAPVVSCPLNVRLAASAVGGLIGALNPVYLLLKPPYLDQVLRRLLHAPEWGMWVGWVFVSLLFLPCFAATFLLYPRLYDRLVARRREGRRVGVLGYTLTGTAFGVMATVFAAFFVSLQFFTVGVAAGQFRTLTELSVVLIGGSFYFALIGISLLPLIALTGGLFVWGNDVVLRRRLEREAEASKRPDGIPSE